MSFFSLLNKNCTIRRKILSATKNTHGQPLETSVLTTGIPCALQQFSGQEGRNKDQSAISRFKWYGPWGTVIAEKDEVVIDDKTYVVLEVKDAAGRGHHLKAILERIKVSGA